MFEWLKNLFFPSVPEKAEPEKKPVAKKKPAAKKPTTKKAPSTGAKRGRPKTKKE